MYVKNNKCIHKVETGILHVIQLFTGKGMKNNIEHISGLFLKSASIFCSLNIKEKENTAMQILHFVCFHECCHY